jgi:hypothetical protein
LYLLGVCPESDLVERPERRLHLPRFPAQTLGDFPNPDLSRSDLLLGFLGCTRRLFLRDALHPQRV